MKGKAFWRRLRSDDRVAIDRKARNTRFVPVSGGSGSTNKRSLTRLPTLRLLVELRPHRIVNDDYPTVSDGLDRMVRVTRNDRDQSRPGDLVCKNVRGSSPCGQADVGSARPAVGYQAASPLGERRFQVLSPSKLCPAIRMLCPYHQAPHIA